MIDTGPDVQWIVGGITEIPAHGFPEFGFVLGGMGLRGFAWSFHP